MQELKPDKINFLLEMAPNTTNSDMTNRMGELNSPGQLTTWSNLGSGGAGGGTHQIRIIDGKLATNTLFFCNRLQFNIIA
jgi:hypothetical protein